MHRPIPIVFLVLLATCGVASLFLEPWQINIAVDCFTVAIGFSFLHLAIKQKAIQEAMLARNPLSEHLMVVGIAGVLFATVLIRGFRLYVWSQGALVPIDTYTFAFVSLIQLFGFALLLIAAHNTSNPFIDRAIRSLTYAVLGGLFLSFLMFGQHYIGLFDG